LLDEGLRVTNLVSPRYLTKWNIGVRDISPFFEIRKKKGLDEEEDAGVIVRSIKAKFKREKNEKIKYEKSLKRDPSFFPIINI
jgi:hypothetical protein